MAVRCIRCGASVDGYSQVCSSCAAQKKQTETAAREAAVKATTNLCPSCSQEIPRAAEACPNCSRSFAQTGAKFIPLVRADFFVRLVAYLIDSFGFGFVAGIFIVAIGNPFVALPVVYLAFLVAQVGFWLTLGATPGKLLMGIKIVSEDGDPIGIGHCVFRCFGYFICNVTGGILYLLIAINASKRGVEDMLSGTMVVYRDSIPDRKPKTETVSAT